MRSAGGRIPSSWNRRMIKMPLVSVVIALPSRNDRAVATLESVIRQNYRSVEVIIACGEDAAISIKHTLESEAWNKRFCNNFTVLKKPEKKGKIALLKDAIDAANGEYISFIEPGDLYDMDRITLLMQSIQAEDALIGVGLLDLRGRQNHTYYRYLHQLERFSSAITFFPSRGLACLAGANVLVTGNIIIERGFLNELGGLNDDYFYLYQQDLLVRSVLHREPMLLNYPLDSRFIAEKINEAELHQEEFREMEKIPPA